jgi:outer membrane murein-binding lipoprotein Lpp
MVAGQSVALGLTIALVVYLGSRVQQLEARVDALQSEQGVTVSPAANPVTAARSSAAAAGERRLATRKVRPDPSSGAATDGDADGSNIDDHLWSDGGRQAIGDVVEEREEADRERRTERWKRMTEYRTEQAVGTVAEQLELSARETEEVSTLVTSYMEVRSSRWRKMSDDEDVDIAVIEREYEENKAQIEQDIVGVIGEDGLELLHEEMRSGWR